MGYVKEILGANETIVYTASFHWLYTAAAVFWIVIGVLFALFGLVPALVISIIGIVMLIRKWTTEMAVTTRRFIYKRGWIARRSEEISLGKLEELNLRQSILGRLFGFGSLHLSGTGLGKINLPTIDNPIELRRAIDAAKNKSA